MKQIILISILLLSGLLFFGCTDTYLLKKDVNESDLNALVKKLDTNIWTGGVLSKDDNTVLISWIPNPSLTWSLGHPSYMWLNTFTSYLYTNDIDTQTFFAGDVSEFDGDVNFDGDVWFNDSYWDDVYVPLLSTNVGAQPPDVTAFNGARVYEFQNNVLVSEDDVFFTFQMPHSYKLGSDIESHLHWTPDSNNLGNARFLLDCAYADIDGGFVNRIVSYDANANSPLINVHKVVDANTHFNCSNISCIMQCHLWRNSSAAIDNYASGIFLHAIDFHIEMNSLGSRDEYLK